MAKEHKNLTGADLHIARFATGAGSPQGARIPGIVGEAYYDTQGLHLWIAYGATATSWNGPFSVLTSAAGLPTNPASFDGLLSGSDTTVQAALETLDGHHHDGRYALTAHGHTGVYSPVGHDHAGTYAQTSHTHPLSALTQSGAATGQVATWNGSAWAPATPAGGGGGAGALNDLADVDTATAPPTTGQALAWSGSLWVPQTITGGATTLDALTDVQTSGAYAPADGQSLAWNATANQWRPTTITGGAGGSFALLIKTGDYTIPSTEATGLVGFINLGAAGEVVLTLPTPVVGRRVWVMSAVAGQNLKVKIHDPRYTRLRIYDDGTDYVSVTTSKAYQTLIFTAINSTYWLLTVVEGAAGVTMVYAHPEYAHKAKTVAYTHATWGNATCKKWAFPVTDTWTSLSNWPSGAQWTLPVASALKVYAPKFVGDVVAQTITLATDTKGTVNFTVTAVTFNTAGVEGGHLSQASLNTSYHWKYAGTGTSGRADKFAFSTETPAQLTGLHSTSGTGYGHACVMLEESKTGFGYTNYWNGGNSTENKLSAFYAATETYNLTVASFLTEIATTGAAACDGYNMVALQSSTTPATQKWWKLDLTTYTRSTLTPGIHGWKTGTHSMAVNSELKYGIFGRTDVMANTRQLTFASETWVDLSASGMGVNYSQAYMGAA